MGSDCFGVLDNELHGAQPGVLVDVQSIRGAYGHPDGKKGRFVIKQYRVDGTGARKAEPQPQVPLPDPALVEDDEMTVEYRFRK